MHAEKYGLEWPPKDVEMLLGRYTHDGEWLADAGLFGYTKGGWITSFDYWQHLPTKPTQEGKGETDE